MLEDLSSFIHHLNPYVGLGMLGLVVVFVVWRMIADMMPHHAYLKSRPLSKYGRTRRKALRGDAKACVHAAKMLEKGTDGAPHSPHRADELWRHAASLYFHKGRNGDPYGYLMYADIINRDNKYPQISKEADRWYRLALKGFVEMADEDPGTADHTNGNAFAGYMYRWGLGCVTDHDKAAKYLEAAARAGHAASMKSLAELYLLGHGGKPKGDPVTAASWLRQAALKGDAEARERVGDNYLSSMGEIASREMAYFWYSLAARQGRREAMHKLQMIEQDWTPKQLREVQAKMQGWVVA